MLRPETAARTLRIQLLLAAAGATFAACAATGGPGDEGCGDRLLGDLVVSELLLDPDGADTGKEYIELYNATNADIDLADVTLYVAAPDEKKTTLRAGTIPPRGYFVLTDARSELWPDHLDNAYGDWIGALPKDGGRIGIRCANTLIDEVSYGKTRLAHARELDGALVPDGTLNDLDTSWCDATLPIAGTSDFGTPGAPNMPCPTAADSCTDLATGHARDVVKPGAGALVVSEVMADPAAVADNVGEWIEVTAVEGADLNGLELGNEGTGTTTVKAPACLPLAAGMRAIFARSTDPSENGGLPVVTAPFSFALANSGTAAAPRGVVLTRDGVEIDRMTYTLTKAGISWQVSEDRLDAAANDDSAAWCPTATTDPAGVPANQFGGGDHGTPAAPNGLCP